MQIDIYTQKGEKKAKATLPKEMFEVEVKEGLIHMALKRQLSNARTNIAHTKMRGEVRGGGRKPFKQKGTGRARQGSNRSPILRGGGITFGPKNNRNFTIQMPKKQRRKALFMALTKKAEAKKVFGLEDYADKDMKTKNAHEMIAKLPVTRNVLFVVEQGSGQSDTLMRTTKNLVNAKTILVNYLNIHDLAKYDSVCFVSDSIKKAQELFVK